MALTKKIENVYNYMDYRILLNDDFLGRTNSNHSYSLRAYSRDLDLSPGFVSDVLRGNKMLSPSTGRDVFSKLGFADKELDYVEKLVQFKAADETSAKTHAYEYIQQHYNRDKFKVENDRDLYIKTPEHLLVYGLIRREERLEKVTRYALQLGISETQVLDIVSDFKSQKYIQEENGRFTILKETIIKSHDDMVPTIKAISDLMFTAIHKQGGIKLPERACHSLIVGLDKASLELASEAQKHFIQTLHRISQQNTKPEHFLLYLDVFFVLTDVP